MTKKKLLLILFMTAAVTTQAAVTKCVITNVPSASGDVHAVITCLSGDSLSNVRFGYTMLNGVPVGGNLTNYVDLSFISGTANRLYKGAVASALPTGGSYWYWVEGEVGSGSVINFCGRLLNQWRYLNAYGVDLATAVSGTDWNSTLTGLPESLGNTFNRKGWQVKHKYADWATTNMTFDKSNLSVNFANTNGNHLVGLRSPVIDSGMADLRFSLAWNDVSTTNNLLVYVVTNDIVRASDPLFFSTVVKDSQWGATNCLPVYTAVYPGAPGRARSAVVTLYTDIFARVPSGQKFLVWFVRDGFSWASYIHPNFYIRLYEVQIVPPTAALALSSVSVTPRSAVVGTTSVVSVAASDVYADWPAVNPTLTYSRRYGATQADTPMALSNGVWVAVVTNGLAGVSPSWVSATYTGFDSGSSALAPGSVISPVTYTPVYSDRIPTPPVVTLTLTDLSYDSAGGVTNCTFGPSGVLTLLKRQLDSMSVQ